MIESSLVSGVEEKPTVPVFPNVALFEKLTEFNATSEEHVEKVCRMFGTR